MDNTITITPSGIAIGSPLVAGTQLSVTATGMEVAEDAALFLIVTSRFPDLLIASCPLSETTTEGEYAGTLYTATKQMSLFLVNARADEARSASIELVDTAHGASLARTTVPIYNSSLIPQPCRWPSASPIYVPGPAASVLVGTTTTLPPGSPASVENAGTSSDAVLNFGIPQGPKGDPQTPSDATPQMDGVGAAGTATTYARGDHRHPVGDRVVCGDTELIARNDGIAVIAKKASENLLEWPVLRVSAGASIFEDATHHTSWPAGRNTTYDFNRGTPVTSVYGPGRSIQDGGMIIVFSPAYGLHGIISLNSLTRPIYVSRVDGADMTLDFSGLDATGSFFLSMADYSSVKDVATKDQIEQLDEAVRGKVSRSGDIMSGELTIKPDTETSAAILDAYDEDGEHGAYVNLIDGDKSVSIGVEGNYPEITKSIGTENYSYTLPNKSGTFATMSDISGKADSASLAAAYDPEKSPGYAVGDYCTYQGVLYRCTTATANPPGAWNAANWTAVAVTDEVAGKADAASLRYAFASPTPTVSGTVATVACEDRAINDFTVATGITSLTITPPAAVTGRARDFFCRVTLTDSSLPKVTLSGATIDIGEAEVAGMTQGVNLLMFTEIASGHWLASRRSAS